jgi:hypothetical protein
MFDITLANCVAPPFIADVSSRGRVPIDLLVTAVFVSGGRYIAVVEIRSTGRSADNSEHRGGQNDGRDAETLAIRHLS